MKMKKLILLSLLFLLTFSAFSQHKEREERIKTLKIAFITERLAFTESEAQKFWPIYNAFEEENNNLRRDSYDKRKVEDFESMTEADAKSLLDEMSSIENKRHKLREKFMKDLLAVLPAKKVILLKTTEDEFNKKMFEEFKKRRQEKEERP
jgi:Skp family chaperone for outer membrane proteins